jgi:hypothetical protein
MSDELHALRQDLRPVINIVRGYRLFFSLLFWLTLIVVGSGIVLEMWSQQKKAGLGTFDNQNNRRRSH